MSITIRAKYPGAYECLKINVFSGKPVKTPKSFKLEGKSEKKSVPDVAVRQRRPKNVPPKPRPEWCKKRSALPRPFLEQSKSTSVPRTSVLNLNASGQNATMLSASVIQSDSLVRTPSASAIHSDALRHERTEGELNTDVG